MKPFREAKPTGYWKDIATRRQFFDNLAREWGFKSLDDWYQVPTTRIVKYGGRSVLDYHEGSLAKGTDLTIDSKEIVWDL